MEYALQYSLHDNFRLWKKTVSNHCFVIVVNLLWHRHLLYKSYYFNLVNILLRLIHVQNIRSKLKVP